VAVELTVSTLGTLYEMAREGAGLAARRLTGMAGVPTRVGVTRLNFMHGRDIRSELADDRRREGVQVDLSGGFEGASVLAFEAASTADLVDGLLDDVSREGVDDIERSAVVELCHVMNAGFVDGWADVLDVGIDVSTPRYVAGDDPETLLSGLESAPADDDLALLFRSTIEAVDTSVAFDHFLFPERRTVAAMLERRRTGENLESNGEKEGIEFGKLVGFDRMADRGAERVAANLTKMTDIDTTVDVRRINFLSLDTIPEEVPNEELVSVAFRFTGTPSGYLAFVYDLDSARDLVEAALPRGLDPDTGPDADGLGEMGRDAVGEFSNVMASGFLDGWANVLDTTIEHTTPRFTRDLGAAVVDPLVVGLSREQEFAFVFDTHIASPNRAFDVDVYAVPDESTLEAALSTLDVSKVADTDVVAEFDVAGTDRDDSVAGLDGAGGQDR
jgi:chemotaxis protein CheC